MCGIAGFIDAKLRVPAEMWQPTLLRMGGALGHRGPDDYGVWTDTNAGIGLAHRRLAILDVSPLGHQPMESVSGRYVIIFNGEIYNHLDLRRQLPGAQWRGHSDTETLLAGFDAWGIVPTIERAVGMFAIALWDRQTRILTLVRDRLGEKPLYYGWVGDTFVFGSELKALRRHPAFNGEIDRQVLTAFLRYSYVPAPTSIYRGIYKLPPGSLLTARADDSDRATPHRYWSLLAVARRGLELPFVGSDNDALEALEARVSEAVRLQQVADVPLGAFLSGGIDSSTIVALMQTHASRPVRTFTIGFNDDQYNEAHHAKVVAQHLGTDHTELYVTPEEARNVIPKLPVMYDEPFADVSQIPTFLVSQLARRSVTVSLSGDAGDELFGGYNRYVWARKLLQYPNSLRCLFARGLMFLSPSQWDRVYQACRPLLPVSLRIQMPGDRAHKLAAVLSAQNDADLYQRLVATWSDANTLVLGGQDIVDSSTLWQALNGAAASEHKMMASDALTYLPDDILAKVDRAAMAVSLETRVPLLDHRVVEFAWSLPLHMHIREGRGKWILRQLLYKHVPKKLVERPKMGFGMPIGAWLRGPLREWSEGLLDASRLRQEGYLDPAPVRRKWTEHISGTRSWQYQLWNVLMFQSWLAEQR